MPTDASLGAGVTVREVAAQAGVSRQTVSNVFNAPERVTRRRWRRCSGPSNGSVTGPTATPAASRPGGPA